jgi:hypothetical protein
MTWKFGIVGALALPSLALAQVPAFGPATRVVDRILYGGTTELADFDGDGDLDVFVAGDGNNTLGWFAQEAPGDFSWVKLFPEETMADDWNDMEVVDWDGDGLADIVACEEGGLVYCAQQADGTLAPAVLLRASPSPFRLEIADVNGDEILDVTYADNQSNEVTLMLGLGGGAVTEATEPEALAGAALATFADWNGDGLLDWLYGSYTWGQLYVRLGFGNGGFAPGQILADFGKLSAVASLPGGGGDLILGVDDTYVLRWHADGTPPDTLGLFGKAQQFAFGDATGDGVLDIAVAAQVTNECGLIVGDGAGGFLPEPTEFNVPQALDIELGDIDGDGIAEMITSSRTRGQVGFRNFDGNGAAVDYTPLIEGLQYVRNAATGDLNGDGLDDIATMVQGTNLYGGGPEYLNVAFARPEGGFEVTYVATGTYFGYDVELADYDGDNDLDAVVSDYNGDRVVGLRNDGTGTLTLTDTLIANINGCDDVLLHDLDGDGDLDLVAGAWQGSSSVFALNNGTGTFAEPVTLPNTGSRCEAVVAGDFNGDGLEDIAACFENSGDVRIWLQTAEMAFAQPQILPLASAQDLALADADADGDLDLFGVGYNETGVLLYTNPDGSGLFLPGTAFGFTDLNGTLGLTAADPDGDGLAELVVSEYGGARTRLFHGATGAVLELATGNNPQNARFGDFDGDGDADLALTFYSSAEIKWVELLSGLQPPPCPGDVDLNGLVTTDDLTLFLAAYGCGSGLSGTAAAPCGPADFDGDGDVSVQDFLLLLGMFGSACSSN